jgi:anti-sigma B factor antagonist
MNPGGSNLSVWVEAGKAYVRVTGRANFTSSVDFKKLVRRLQEQGCQHMVLDLSECVLMDSTFLGVLASEGQRRAVEVEGKLAPGFELVNASSRVFELIDNLGVAHLFKITQLDLSAEAFKAVEPAQGVSRDEITRTCLEAHETLMALNPANVPKFKDVTHFFAENLKKSQGQS